MQRYLIHESTARRLAAVALALRGENPDVGFSDEELVVLIRAACDLEADSPFLLAAELARLIVSGAWLASRGRRRPEYLANFSVLLTSSLLYEQGRRVPLDRVSTAELEIRLAALLPPSNQDALAHLAMWLENRAEGQPEQLLLELDVPRAALAAKKAYVAAPRAVSLKPSAVELAVRLELIAQGFDIHTPEDHERGLEDTTKQRPVDLAPLLDCDVVAVVHDAPSFGSGMELASSESASCSALVLVPTDNPAVSRMACWAVSGMREQLYAHPGDEELLTREVRTAVAQFLNERSESITASRRERAMRAERFSSAHQMLMATLPDLEERLLARPDIAIHAERLRKIASSVTYLVHASARELRALVDLGASDLVAATVGLDPASPSNPAADAVHMPPGSFTALKELLALESLTAEELLDLLQEDAKVTTEMNDLVRARAVLDRSSAAYWIARYEAKRKRSGGFEL